MLSMFFFFLKITVRVIHSITISLVKSLNSRIINIFLRASIHTSITDVVAIYAHNYTQICVSLHFILLHQLHRGYTRTDCEIVTFSNFLGKENKVFIVQSPSFVDVLFNLHFRRSCSKLVTHTGTRVPSDIVDIRDI